MSISNIYKVNYYVNNKVKKIFVFFTHNNYTGDELLENFNTNHSNELFNNIFNLEEIANISTNNIAIKFCNQKIYMDDTIENIKRKIISEFDSDIAFEEIYLFGKVSEKLNNISVYQNLTQNDKLTLTSTILIPFISNINISVSEYLQIKTKYDYNDILSLNLEQQEFISDKPIGQQFVSVHGVYTYTINPYNVVAYDTFLSENVEKITSTHNNELLLNFGEIYNNNIYLCIAEDVLTYSNASNLLFLTTLKIYYPFLISHNITSISEFQQKRNALITASRKPNINMRTYNKSIELFYDIYNTKKNLLNYKAIGITHIHFMQNSEFSFNFPLDIIFKLLHSTSDVPIIKYNPSKRQENIYRIYCDTIAINGKKIPYLSKGTIFKLIKNIGKSKSVTSYIEYIYHKIMITLTCEFKENGEIIIESSFDEPLSIEEITDIIKIAVNPIINIVKIFLENSGYSLNLFNSFNDKHIEIIDLNFQNKITITKELNLQKYIKCLSNVFYIINNDINDIIKLRFKRVSNYNEFEAQTGLIIDLVNKKVSSEQIIEELQRNFNLSEHEAQIKLTDVLSELEIVQDATQNKKSKIKDNPGFYIEILKEKHTPNIIINISGINNIKYLLSIPVYIDSLIRLTQNTGIDDKFKKVIVKICNVKIDEKLKKTAALKTQIIQEYAKIKDIVSLPEIQNTTLNIKDGIIIEEVVVSKKANILNFMFDEDEDDDEDEGADEEKEGINGGENSNNSNSNSSNSSSNSSNDSLSNGDNDTEKKLSNTDITGMNLKKPNPFFSKLYAKEPTLFLNKDDGPYVAYSRACPSNVRRQPVILTDKEKEYIDKFHNGSYNKAIKYGSNPNNQYWYICPRYWSLTDNVSLTEEQAKSGKYGGIIPEKASKVPVGSKIYEFKHQKQHTGKNGAYVEHYPGFLKSDIHPKGLCIPCCFKTWNNPEQTKRRQECALKQKPTINATKIAEKKNEPKAIIPIKKIEENKNIGVSESKTTAPIRKQERNQEIGAEKKQEPSAIVIPARKPIIYETSEAKKQEKQEKIKDNKDNKENKIDKYIKSVEKFPLELNRWGYLPLSIQIFLGTDNTKCYTTNINTELKSNHKCLLRNGVENNKLQSFIACIASTFIDINNKKKHISIIEMKKIIIKSLTLDNFITFHNGNLVKIFENNNITIKLTKYNNTNIYKTIKQTDTAQMQFLTKLIKAYENFINFLNDDNIIIDHTYLWDIISIPNKNLFPNGINIIILEIPNNDITSNVNLICPSNNYSNEMFNVNKSSLILMKSGNYYEPIYTLEDKITEWEITRLFNLRNQFLMPSLKNILDVISKTYSSKCIPFNSQPNIYTFKQNIALSKLILYLNELRYTINYQIMNFDAKIIGVIAVNTQNNTCFVPCYPSSSVNTINIKMMDESDIWTDFQSTFDFLILLSNESKKNILCLPQIKVLEDGLIIGLLTETNQFIATDRPEQNKILMEMKTIDSNNHIISDIVSTTINTKDNERATLIKIIKMENNFYNIFRNTIRILLGTFSNKQIKTNIEKIIDSPYLLYQTKISNLNTQLKELTKNHIGFINYKKDILLSIINTNITSCGLSNCENKKYCLKQSDEYCKLLIPKKNLINNINNESSYFIKISDELLRFNRISQFIFEPKTFLSFSDIKYNLQKDEIILLQSLLTQEYFENLIISNKNKYILNNTYDITNPIISQTYSNIIEDDIQPKNVDNTACSITKQIIGGTLKKLFPKTSLELIFGNTPNICTFEIMTIIINDNNKINKNEEIITKHKLKDTLIEEYTKYDIPTKSKILNILFKQGKKITLKVKSGEITFDRMIIDENYYMTSLDIWIIAIKYNAPIVFLSGTTLFENNERLFITNSDTSENYYFIKIPAISDKIPSYKLFVVNKKAKISPSILSQELQEQMRQPKSSAILYNFIHNFENKSKRFKIIE